MKILDVIKTANQNLLRNKARSFLTILAIFVGSFTIVLTTAINTGVNNFIDQQTDNYGGEGILTITAKDLATTMSLDSNSVPEYNEANNGSVIQYLNPDDVDKISKIDGVKNVIPSVISTVEYITSNQTNKKYTINTRPFNSDSINVDIVAGRSINAQAQDYEIVLPPNYSTALGFRSDEDAIGKTITLATKQPVKCYTVTNIADCTVKVDAKVVGVQAPGVISTGSAWLSEGLNERLINDYQFGMSSNNRDQYMMVSADTEPDKIPEIKDKLDKMGFAALTVRDTANAVKSFFDVILVVLTIFGYIALAAAAIGIINTLLMSVQERTREIGLNKALGMSSGKIFLSFSLEAISLGFWGSLVGVLVAMGVGNLVNSILHLPNGLLASFPTFSLVEFTLPNIITIMLIIMLIAFIAGTVPAIKAARKDPIEALRYE